MCKNLIAALPKAKAVELTGEEEECNMSEVDLSQFGQDQGGAMGKNQYDEDDEDDARGAGGQKVQCQNM